METSVAEELVAVPTATAAIEREWETEGENRRTLLFSGQPEWGQSLQLYADCLNWEVYHTNLQELTLDQMGITGQDIGPIVTLILMHRSLEYLNLSRNQDIGDDGATQLAIATRNGRLRTLCLADCKITDQGAKQLALHTNVNVLFLQNNLISDDGAMALLDVNNCRFEELFLAQNEIGNEGAAAIAQVIANSPIPLVRLSLLGNDEITTVWPFVEALEADGATSSLRYLTLTPNWFIRDEQHLLHRIMGVLVSRRNEDDLRRTLEDR